MTDPIERAIHEIQVHRRRSAVYANASWRAAVDERLRAVEDAIADLRTRINSVLALIAAAVIGQIALRLLGH
jgi:hypothetical protein